MSETPLLASWDRYTHASFIGEGGMGRVYRAFDTQLRREVALKFISRDEERHAERFLREARLQARIGHPNVCRIYEVSRHRDRLYIAMQYIAGPALLEARHRMSLREKLAVMRAVGEAVHCAHLQGLIHRDIKPSNILLEESGGWWPYVLDFGLAREIGSEALTSTDAVLGTPQYLAPEQLRPFSALDCRTDVYGIGATLYELLTGQPPFGSTLAVDLYMKILQAEPRRPRSIDPSIPADVETIVLKCLEKEPARRYATAADVRADIDRFLAGEPIAARPPTWLRRVSRAASRHKAITAAAITVVLAAGAWIGNAVRSERDARRSEAAAAEFGQELVYIERLLQHAYATPLHDVRGERARVRERVRGLEQKAAAGGPAAGPGNYAAGRALLLLGDVDGATGHLQRAWDGGYRLPEVAYALGKSLGILYEREIGRIDRLPSPQARAERRAEADRTLRWPAIEFLTRSRGVRFESPLYLQALIACYDGRSAAALEALGRAREDSPWLYEASTLEGRIRTEAANRRRDAGEYPEATLEYAAADRQFEAALRVAPSDPEVRDARCALASEAVALAASADGNTELALRRALDRCDEALLAAPDLVTPRLHKSNAWIQWATHQRNHGMDPAPAVASAVRLAVEAARLAPRDEWASLSVGLAYWWTAVDRFRRGEDPRPALEEVVHSFERTIRLNPRLAHAYMNVGNAHLLQADYERRHGRDPRAAVAAALHAFDRALGVEPTFVAWNNIAYAHLQKALYVRDAGGDPSAAFDSALRAAQKAVAVNGSVPHSHNTLATVWWRIAEWRIDHHRPAVGALAQARAAIARSIAIHPSFWESYAIKGNVAAAAGREIAGAGMSPRASFDEAHEAFDRAVALNGNDAWLLQRFADLHLREAEWQSAAGADSRASIADGIRLIDRAIALNPADADSLAVRGRLYALLARTGGGTEARRRATENFARAHALQPSFGGGPLNAGGGER